MRRALLTSLIATVAALGAPAGAAALPPALGTLSQAGGVGGCLVDASASLAGCDGNGLGLDGVSAVTVSPDGRNAYAVAATADALLSYARDPASGALTPLAGAACITQSAFPPAGCTGGGRGLDGARDVLVSPDGANVYVAGQDADAIATFTRGATGALTQLAGGAGCLADGGSATPGCTADGRALNGPDGLAASRDGKNLYVAAATDGAVVALARATSGPAAGSLTQVAGTGGCVVDSGSPQAGCDGTGRALAGARSVAASPDGKTVYAAAPGSDGVAALARDTSSAAHGALRPLAGADGCVVDSGSPLAGCDSTGRALAGARSVAVTLDGTGVLVAAQDSNGVASLARTTSGPGTGALVQVSGNGGCVVDVATPFVGCDSSGRGLAGAGAVAISLDSRSVYATATGSDSVSAFSRASGGPGQGGLAQMAGGSGCLVDAGAADITDCDNSGRALADPDGLSVAPNGGSVHVAAAGSKGLAALRREAAPACASFNPVVDRNGSIRFTLPCSDANGDPIRRAILSPPKRGMLGPIDQGTGAATYTPKRGFLGSDAFTYTATDNSGDPGKTSRTATVIVTVQNGDPDTNIKGLRRRVRRNRLRHFHGTASDEAGISKVEIALVAVRGGAQSAAARCLALTKHGRLRGVKPGAGGKCQPVRFLRARGKRHWSYRLRRPLSRGSYVLYSRATDSDLAREQGFSTRDHNRVAFRVY